MRKDASFVSVATAVALATTALGGGMYVGALASDVQQLQEQQKTTKEDHDRLIVVEQSQKTMEKDLDEVKTDVKLILTAITEIQQKVQ